MNKTKMPRIASRTVVITLIVVAIALVGGVWAVGAQTDDDDDGGGGGEPPRPSDPLPDTNPSEAGFPGACLIIDPGAEGQKKTPAEFIGPPCEFPNVQIQCRFGVGTEQASSVPAQIFNWVYNGPGGPGIGGDLCAIFPGLPPSNLQRGGITQ